MTSKLHFEIDGNIGFITLTDPPNNKLAPTQACAVGIFSCCGQEMQKPPVFFA